MTALYEHTHIHAHAHGHTHTHTHFPSNRLSPTHQMNKDKVNIEVRGTYKLSNTLKKAQRIR